MSPVYFLQIRAAFAAETTVASNLTCNQAYDHWSHGLGYLTPLAIPHNRGQPLSLFVTLLRPWQNASLRVPELFKQSTGTLTMTLRSFWCTPKTEFPGLRGGADHAGISSSCPLKLLKQLTHKRKTDYCYEGEQG